ncbi:MAG: thiamine-phosphate kinase [Alphaproteobacteria bacterium]|nr:MAG: thiamine-phosphate kinase [Alphaproteobacteria bacterium]TAF14616.1 MAG: thiamine-phosphate kinase [Alphaproteobacteria bacterium]TAF41703.1 MAG: thiamine-phosphate kinase [Alphaproteobacteria bacterium]TAF75644.1 MAG: thiamine-phosphate kinase [Alphaproteobacteria bacterium]
MKERHIIEQLLMPLASSPWALGLRDDAAYLPSLPHGIVITTDMLQEDIHFLRTGTPAQIAHKALAVNLSDLAAMGAQPHSYQLALALTDAQDEAWLRAFCAALETQHQRYTIALTGGDIIRASPRLTLSITAMGCTDAPLLRSNARVGDGIYVTGTLGDAALGLHHARGDVHLPEPYASYVVERYWYPSPRLSMGIALRHYATSAMDISDGLMVDMRKLCDASSVGARLYYDLLPLSAAGHYAQRHHAQLWQHCYSAGDDYELLFTMPNLYEADVRALCPDVAITHIGEITCDASVMLLDANGAAINPHYAGYEH